MKRNEILFILISATVIVFAWIIFSVYHNFITSTISITANINIFPINPNFNMQTIGELKKREKITPVLELKNTTTITPTPTINLQTNAATSSSQSTSTNNESTLNQQQKKSP